VNKTTYQPLMSSIAVKGYRSANVMNRKIGYWEPFVVTTLIPNQKNGHYVRPNKVAFKYHDFKKDVNPNVHVKVFNSTI
jgi:hypothetical protein